jgi:hypothetical protein
VPKRTPAAQAYAGRRLDSTPTTPSRIARINPAASNHPATTSLVISSGHAGQLITVLGVGYAL